MRGNRILVHICLLVPMELYKRTLTANRQLKVWSVLQLLQKPMLPTSDHHVFTNSFCAHLPALYKRIIHLNYFGATVAKSRVAKCHRYGRYICVKILEGWGKKCRRPRSFVKWSSFGANSTNCNVVLSLNQPYLLAFFTWSSHVSQFHLF